MLLSLMLLVGCHKVPFIVAAPPGPVPAALSAPAAPAPNEVVPGVASTVEAKTAGTTRLKLATSVAGLAPFDTLPGLKQGNPSPGAKLLRGLLEAGFRSVVDLGVSSSIAATVQRASGADQVKLDGSMTTLMRYARLSKADFLIVVADAYARPYTRTLEVLYTLPPDATDAYRAHYAQFGTDVAGTNELWTTKEHSYTEIFRAATADYEANGGKYWRFIIKNQGQKKKDAFNSFINDVARYRQENQRALDAMQSPDALLAAVKARKEVREVQMTEVHLTVHVVSPPGGDLLRIVDVDAVQDSETKATDVAIARLVEELKNL